MQNFLQKMQLATMSPTCLRCDSYFSEKLFCCGRCLDYLRNKYQKFECDSETISALDLFTLIQWVSGASDTLSQAVHLLKRPESKSVWQFLAHEFANQIRRNLIITCVDTALIPVPSRRKLAAHSKYFSDFMSVEIGAPKIDLFFYQKELDNREQKSLSRQERERRPNDFDVDFTRLTEARSFKNIVLIDDVVTTGATLTACKKLLRTHGIEARLSAWVVFKRL